MKNYNFEPQHNDTNKNVTNGLLNAGVTQMVSLFVQFSSIIILSRLLAPSDFGLLAMVAPIYGFAALFQDVGLNQATVQKDKIGHDAINAFFWINIAVGMVLAILLAVLSPVAGWYYHEPRVVELTIGMGLLILIGSFSNQHSAILQRRMKFGSLSIIGMLGSLGGLATSIAWAYYIGDYWALYFGMAVAIIIPSIGVWVATKWIPSAPRRVSGIRGMLMFGAGITSTNIMGFFARNLDNVLIGRTWGNQELGMYDRGYKLLMFPLQRIVSPIGGVMIPVMSRLVNEPEQYRNIFLKTIGQLTFAIWPGIMWAFMSRDTLVPTLLGKNWTEVIAIFTPLAIAGFVQVVNHPIGWLFITQGRSGDYARCGLITAITSILAFVIGLPYGAVGVATAYAISEFIRMPFIWWYVTRRGPIVPLDVITAVTPQCVSCLASGVALFIFYNNTNLPPLILLGSGCVLSYSVFTLTMALFPSGRKTINRTIATFRHLMLRVKLS